MSQCGTAFRSFVQSLHTCAQKSYWYCAFEQEGENLRDLSGEVRDKLGRTIIRQQELVHKLSLQRQSGIGREEYTELLLECGLLRKKGKQILFRKEEWENLLSKFDGAKITKFKEAGYPGCGQRYFLRLSPKQDGYRKTAIVSEQRCLQSSSWWEYL